MEGVLFGCGVVPVLVDLCDLASHLMYIVGSWRFCYVVNIFDSQSTKFRRNCGCAYDE